MKLVDVIKALSQLAFGSAEYLELFEKAKATFREDEQEVLQHAYEDAKAKSDAAHETLQSDLKAAAKK
jgi:hypothetical protein